MSRFCMFIQQSIWDFFLVNCFVRPTNCEAIFFRTQIFNHENNYEMSKSRREKSEKKKNIQNIYECTIVCICDE